MKLKKVTLVPVLIIALTLATLPMTGCDDSDLKKAARATDDLARGINILLDLDAALIQQNIISRDDALTITNGILNVNRLAKVFNDKARTYKSLDADAKSALLKITDDILAALGTLNAQGVLKIKNSNSQAQFQAGYAVLTAAVATLRTLLQKGSN